MTKLFDEAIKTLAKVYSGDMTTELTVDYDGGPSYDVVDHIMHLPYQIGEDATQYVEDEFRVFLGHESYERRWRKLSDKMMDGCKANRCLKMWFNATGDVSLEEEMSEEYPGLGLLSKQKNIEIAHSLMNNIDDARAKGRPTEPNHNLVAAFGSLIESGAVTREVCKSGLPPEWHPYINVAADVLSKRKGTGIQEAYDLADECMNKCNAAWHEENEEEDGASAPGSNESEEGEDEAGTVTGGLPFNDNDEDTLAKSRLDDLTEALDDMATNMNGRNPNDGGGKWHQAGRVLIYTFTSDYDVYCEARDIFTGYNTPAGVPDITVNAQLFTTKLRQALTVPVPKHVRRRSKGSLDERVIHELCMGLTDVFKRKLPVPDVSAAAVLSLDLSGSIGWAINTVRHVAGVWNKAFDNVDVPLAIQGWTTGGSTGPMTTVGGHYLSGYDRYTAVNALPTPLYRTEGVNFINIKSFAQKASDELVLENIDKMQVIGSTPTGEGLLWAIKELLHRPERRKLLFFFTDGSPGFASNGPNSVHNKFIRTMAEIAQKNGIEIYPIGLGYDISSHFNHIKVPESAQVSNIEEVLPILDSWVVKAFRDMANKSVQRRMT